MRFEIDTNLTSWECTGNHKFSLFLSLRVEIYCFIWGSCLEKVSVFFLLLLLIYFPSYFFYKVVRNKCENWNFFDLERTLNCWHHLAAILEKISFWKNAKLIISVIIFLSSFSFFQFSVTLHEENDLEWYWSSVAPRGLLRIVSHIPSLRASAYPMYGVLRI